MNTIYNNWLQCLFDTRYNTDVFREAKALLKKSLKIGGAYWELCANLQSAGFSRIKIDNIYGNSCCFEVCRLLFDNDESMNMYSAWIYFRFKWSNNTLDGDIECGMWGEDRHYTPNLIYPSYEICKLDYNTGKPLVMSREYNKKGFVNDDMAILRTKHDSIYFANSQYEGARVDEMVQESSGKGKLKKFLVFSWEGASISPNKTYNDNLQILGVAAGKSKREALKDFLEYFEDYVVYDNEFDPKEIGLIQIASSQMLDNAFKPMGYREPEDIEDIIDSIYND